MVRNTRRLAEQTGFTIVELLIVIVVIAILAAISFIAYNGFSQRATIAHYESAINAYDKGLRMTNAETGSYSGSGSDDLYTCLGRMEDYPATAEFPAGACQVNATSGEVYVSLDPQLSSVIMKNAGNLPALPKNLPTITAWNTRYRGVWVNNEGNYYEIEMVMPDSMPSCPKAMHQYDFDGFYWCERWDSD
ncbi:MAG TPA: prepilin-type N-terminal cleavage/methylation domain-containing protein [Candidatus Saccharimonadales bacterium]